MTSMPKPQPDLAFERDRLLASFIQTRARTESLAAPLSPEDQQLQSMPDTSPTKWHLGHTSWFFEEMVLKPSGIPAFDSRYDFLFNSYYESLGPRQPRPKRGLISRPSAAEVIAYRHMTTERLTRLLHAASREVLAQVLPMIELGIAHEEQHQELLLTDILHAFSQSPLRPAYLANAPVGAGAIGPSGSSAAAPMRFISHPGGLHEVGAPLSGFAFDNERPRHKRWLEPFGLSDRLVTVGELTAFIEQGGYRTPSLWLSEGFDFVRAHSLTSPLYSSYRDGVFEQFTLSGTRTPAGDEPIAHLSYYEADAIARFLHARLPTEAEWELFADGRAVSGNFAGGNIFRPLPAPRESTHSLPAQGRDEPIVHQLFGDAWQWTGSSYEPYPGYQPPSGPTSEYNGKFMVNQMVLRGGSCLSPNGHLRASYRNFWHPHTQFQMAGARLARAAQS